MINKKTYIPITKNNIIRNQAKLSSKPNNFKTKKDLDAEISTNIGKLKTKRFSMKIYGTTPVPAGVPTLGTEGLDILGTESGSGLGV